VVSEKSGKMKSQDKVWDKWKKGRMKV